MLCWPSVFYIWILPGGPPSALSVLFFVASSLMLCVWCNDVGDILLAYFGPPCTKQASFNYHSLPEYCVPIF